VSGTASRGWKLLGLLLTAGAVASVPTARVAAQVDAGPEGRCSETRQPRPADEPSGPDGDVFLSGETDDLADGVGPALPEARAGLVARGACGKPAAQPSLAAIGRFGVAPGLPPAALDLVDRAVPDPSPQESRDGPGAAGPGTLWRASPEAQPAPLRWGLWQGAALMALEDGAARPSRAEARRASRVASDRLRADHPAPATTGREAVRPHGAPADRADAHPSAPTATATPEHQRTDDAGDARARRFLELARADAGPAPTPGSEDSGDGAPTGPSRLQPEARRLPDGPTDRQIAEAVGHRRSAFQRCYAMSVQGLSRPPRVAYEVRLEVTAGGEVDRVRLAARRGDVPRLAECVRTVAEDLDLTGRYADRATVRFPVVFAPGN